MVCQLVIRRNPLPYGYGLEGVTLRIYSAKIIKSSAEKEDVKEQFSGVALAVLQRP